MATDKNTEIYCMNKELFDDIHKTEMSSDYILPDYLPDIKTVLNVFNNAHLKSTYASDGKIEYDGEVLYEILYLSEEGGLKQVSYKSDFTDAVMIKGLDSDSVSYVSLSCEDTSVRVTNPRRVSIRSRVPAHIRAYSNSCIEPMIEGEYDEDDIQYSIKETATLDVCCGFDTGIGVSDDILIPAENKEAEELVGVYLSPKINELKVSDGKVAVLGEVAVNALYQNVDGEYENLNKQVQFSHVCDVECAKEGSECNAELYIYEISTVLNTDQNGQKRVIELDFLYDVSVCCLRNEEVAAAADMYSLKHESDSEYKNIDLKSLYKVYNINVSVNEKMPLTDTDLDRIVFANGEAESCNVQKEGQKLICTGTINGRCIVTRNGEYGNFDFSFPYKAEFDASRLPDEYEYTADCKTSDLKVRFDGSNVYADTEVYLTVSVFTKNSTRVVSKLHVHPDALSVSYMPLTLYYPASGEDIWNIAKRYKTKVSDIISANSLQSTDISSHRVLVIPKK